MAHFAQLNENNVVTQIVVINNSELTSTNITVDENGYINVITVESELQGINFCKSLFGNDTVWVQTSYNGSFRGQYAGIGDEYNVTTNTFVTPLIIGDEYNVTTNTFVSPATETTDPTNQE